MFRRVVSLTLLPCLLLTQSAAIGHSHIGGQPAGHDLRPHVHANSTPAGKPHDHAAHHHGRGGHHHGEVASDPPEPSPTQQPKPASDHDSDAIFVGATDAVAVERSELLGGGASSVWWTSADTNLFLTSWVDPHAHSLFSGHPPPLYGHLCPLYVRYLALLI